MRPHLQVVFALLATATCAGCEGSAEHSGTVKSAGTTELIVVRDSGRIPADKAVALRLAGWKQRLLEAEEEWVIGSANGKDLEIFGRIGSLESHSDRLYVADILTKSLKVYAHDGSPIVEIAKAGGGPLEMEGVLASAHTAAGELVLADPMQLKIFQSAAEGVLVLDRAIQLGVGVQGLCILDSRIFVRTWNRNTNQVVASVTIAGHDTAFFGSGAAVSDENTRYQLSRGRIACADAPKLVAVAFDNEPFIQAYSPDGRLAWMARIDQFRRSDAAKGELTGTVSQSDREKRHDGIATFLALLPDAFLLQVARVQPQLGPGRPPMFKLDSYLLNAETGDALFLGEGVLPLVRAVSTKRYWSVRGHREGYEQVASHIFRTGGTPPPSYNKSPGYSAAPGA